MITSHGYTRIKISKWYPNTSIFIKLYPDGTIVGNKLRVTTYEDIDLDKLNLFHLKYYPNFSQLAKKCIKIT